MPPQPSIAGSRSIVDFFAAGPCLGTAGVTTVEPATANGRPAVIMHRLRADGTDELHGVLVLEVRDRMIVGFDAYIEARHVELFERA